MIYYRNKPRGPPETLSEFKESTFRQERSSLEDSESASRTMLAGRGPTADLQQGKPVSINT
ncbi:Hypothetical protein P9303_02041 [Prochlorococcus marinus str. MIT 9303]|uniref:Uncharacterized protein n=1 Tax=Prochlorococcus marinus (strain MIT 9303) TaxID=59922 RepID=A2C649_PROM3|nr:Hypothetical protein P9303_02041 [Prochlorococcus marinus str. MIT 9303]